MKLHYLDDPPPPPLEWVVRDFIPAGGLVTLAGAPGCGKSALAAALAVAAASGGCWLGRNVARGPAIYVAAEAGNSTRRRLEAMALDIEPSPPIAAATGSIDLVGGDAAAELICLVRAAGERFGSPVRLVIVDALGSATRGADENSARDMSRAMGALLQVIDECGVTVVLLTHTPKTGKDPRTRGHSGTTADVDAHLAVADERSLKRLVVHKMRDGEAGASIPFRLIATNEGGIDAVFVDGAAKPAPSKGVLRGDAALALEALLSTGPGWQAMEAWRSAAYEAFGSRKPDALRRAFHEARKRLLNLGLIEVNGESVRCVSQRENSVSILTPQAVGEREDEREEGAPLGGLLTPSRAPSGRRWTDTSAPHVREGSMGDDHRNDIQQFREYHAAVGRLLDRLDGAAPVAPDVVDPSDLALIGDVVRMVPLSERTVRKILNANPEAVFWLGRKKLVSAFRILPRGAGFFE